MGGKSVESESLLTGLMLSKSLGNKAMRTISENESQQHLKNLQVYGYTIVRNFVEPFVVKRLLTILNNSFNPTKHKEFSGRQERELEDKFVYNLQNKDKYFIDILDDPFLTDLLMQNLNDPFYKHLPADVPNYILGYYTARSSGPTDLPMHTDTFVPSPGDKTWTIQVAFMLEDSTKDNGCTVVVPGSHRSGRFVDRGLDKHEYLEANAGDALIWDSRTWHGTTANKMGASRWAAIALFQTWWVKQRTDIPRSLPEEIYQELTERQKILLGFCSIPPKDEHERLNFKGGYAQLKPSVKDYY